MPSQPLPVLCSAVLCLALLLPGLAPAASICADTSARQQRRPHICSGRRSTPTLLHLSSAEACLDLDADDRNELRCQCVNGSAYRALKCALSSSGVLFSRIPLLPISAVAGSGPLSPAVGSMAGPQLLWWPACAYILSNGSLLKCHALHVCSYLFVSASSCTLSSLPGSMQFIVVLQYY